MVLDIDGFAVLRSIVAHPCTFRNAAPEVAKAARVLVIKQIKNKSSDLKNLRDVRGAVGAESFNLIVDGMPDAQIRSSVAKLDKNCPQLKASALRQYLTALADGSVEPTAKPKMRPKRQRAKKMQPKQTRVPEFLNYSSAGATRKR
jgi:hypothetical protein